MRFSIRKVDASDPVIQAAVNAMIDEVSVGLDWIYGSRCEGGDWWVAFQGKTEVAFGGLVPSAHVGLAGYIAADGVLQRFRGHGIQKRLLRARIAWARAQGYRSLVTDVIHHNVGSINSLIACGFRLFVPEKPWGKPEHVCFWRRPL